MTTRERLTDQILGSAHATYFVVDGARVRNVKRILQDHGFAGRTLFHERAAPELALAGPWLVAVENSRGVLQKAFKMATDCRGGIVWNADCPADDMVLHLRKLNIARLPAEGLVYFRHYDPDVLASMCPLLDGAQAARLLGPARSVSFLAGRGAGATVEKPIDLPPPQQGPLAFHEWQVEELAERQRDLSRKKICAFLRKVVPREVKDKSEADLLQEVIRHEAAANEVGLTSEGAFTQWAHLSLISNDSITKDPSVHRLLASGGKAHADQILDENFYTLISDYYRKSR